MLARPVLTALLAAGVAVFAAGCGNREEIVNHADTEGIYLDVAELDYQVQLSRQLNPRVVPDDAYLTGMPQGILPPEADEVWFAVWVRVQNQTDEPHPTAEEFEIVDTEGTVYRPLELRTDANAFAYRPRVLPPHTTLPPPDSAQATSSTGGAMLLFKLPIEATQNRPLEFKILAPEKGDLPTEATVDLDV